MVSKTVWSNMHELVDYLYFLTFVCILIIFIFIL